MDYIRLGRTDLKVSRLCLGMMSFGDPKWAKWVRGERECTDMVRMALQNGINFFDTADVYSFGESERFLGKAIRQLTTRNDVVIATKFGLNVPPGEHGLSRQNILAAVDQSLTRMKLDYIDLYQMHGWDPAVDIEETIGTLDELIKIGKIRYAGASNFFAWQLVEAIHKATARGSAPLATIQCQYNLAYREEEREMIPVCDRYDIGFIVFSPLARGYLAGIRSKPANDSEATRALSDAKSLRVYGHGQDRAVQEALNDVAGKRGIPPARVALAWLLCKPRVHSIIVGPTEPAHLDNAIKAMTEALGADEIGTLEEGYRPRATETTEIARVPF